MSAPPRGTERVGGDGDTEQSPSRRRCPRANARNFLDDREAWELVTSLHERYSAEPSFIDYFWSIRFMHMPIWKLMAALERVPQAFAYHTVSTGFAGLLGSLVQRRRGRPLILTEHGIYTKERKIELAQAEWIHATRQLDYVPFRGPGYLKELWMRCFDFMGRATYDAAELILTLFDGNRRLQIEHGAPAEKIRIIPNGIEVERYGAAAGAPRGARRPTVGFVGRVVPIKDVKTLIRATRIVAGTHPDVEVLVVGPTDEDPEYFRECGDLVDSLELADNVRFLGKRDVRDIYPQLDVLALTSISEALPLVVLEAQAAGVPVVSTDVGACRELLEGRTDDDRALGASGLLTYIADPEGIARALLRLLGDEQERARMASAGLKRVRRHYDLPYVIGQYRRIYDGYIEMGMRCSPDTLATEAERVAFAEAVADVDARESALLLEHAIEVEEMRSIGEHDGTDAGDRQRTRRRDEN
jgi:glycosyltransferase involved in cell wall biosynthesis